MSGPENETPSRSTRSRSTPPPAAEPAARAGPRASPPASSAPAAPPATAQASAAVSSAMTAVRERLQVGEQILLIGAALIVLDYIIFQVLFGRRIFFGSPSRWSWPCSRSSRSGSIAGVITTSARATASSSAASGSTLLLFAFTNFLSVVRFGITADALELLGLLSTGPVARPRSMAAGWSSAREPEAPCRHQRLGSAPNDDRVASAAARSSHASRPNCHAF